MPEETRPEAKPPLPGEADKPKQAHDETAADVRKLRHGDDIPQGDS